MQVVQQEDEQQKESDREIWLGKISLLNTLPLPSKAFKIIIITLMRGKIFHLSTLSPSSQAFSSKIVLVSGKVSRLQPRPVHRTR